MRGVHAVLPQGPVTTEPRVDLRERLGTQAVYPKLRLLAHVDEAGLTQHSQVSETPGRAIGSRAARSPTVVGPPLGTSSTVVRLSSDNACSTASMVYA